MRKRWFQFLMAVVALAVQMAHATAQRQQISAHGNVISFRINDHRDNSMQNIRGTLSGLKGKIIFDPHNVARANFDLSLDAASVRTGTTGVDNELKGAAYFFASRYAAIRIRSTSVTADGIVYVLHGNLTIKGKSRPVNIQFMATPYGKGYLFRGSFDVKRSDYGLGNKGTLDDTVSVFVEIHTGS